jgi:hypothetical protein
MMRLHGAESKNAAILLADHDSEGPAKVVVTAKLFDQLRDQFERTLVTAAALFASCVRPRILVIFLVFRRHLSLVSVREVLFAARSRC